MIVSRAAVAFFLEGSFGTRGAGGNTSRAAEHAEEVILPSMGHFLHQVLPVVVGWNDW